MRFRIIILIVLSLSFGQLITAQNLDSSNYTLLSPVVGESISTTQESSNFTSGSNTNVFGGFTTSSNFTANNSGQSLTEANIPQVQCLEASSTSATTTCNLPSSYGMDDVCGTGGCYDRVKLEIFSDNNPIDTRYAIQISDNVSFPSTASYFIDGSTRTPKTELEITDFIPKCEWEGTVEPGVCGAGVEFYQAYNILGLEQNKTYYFRVAAQTGGDSQTNLTQTDWSPSQSVTTGSQILTVDLDLWDDLSTDTTPPFEIDFGAIVPGEVNESELAAIVEFESNIMSRMGIYAKTANGALQGTGSINYVNGNLNSLNSGAGIIGSNSLLLVDDNSNSFMTDNIAFNFNYMDMGTTDRVGALTTDFLELAKTSTNEPVFLAKAGFYFRVKPDIVSTSAGEVLTDNIYFIVGPSI